MKKLLLILLLSPLLVAAQIQVSTSFGYALENGFSDNPSFAGSSMELSLRKHISEKFRLTATAGVYDMRKALVAVSNVDYSSKLYGYSYKTIIPVTVGGEYYLWSKKLLKPFIGLETGVFFNDRQLNINENYASYAASIPTCNTLNWGFSPSVGLHLQEFADRLGIFVKVKYTGMTAQNCVGYTDLIGVSGGFTFKFGKKINWRPPVIEVPESTPYYEVKK
ncbi:MAG: hypothetical protein U5N85_07175 [Arcicella sp.]|nr:hypothetical protein [Arcicella sp.]